MSRIKKTANLATVLLAEDEIAKRVRELGDRITEDYAGKELVLVGVLKGALMFIVDLSRRIDLPLELDFMAVSSYGKSTDSSGVVRILKDLDATIENKDVLVVEDIVDSGLTLKYICEVLQARNPASLRVCALLNKCKDRKADVTLDYVGFEIPDRFVVGYGLDYGELYRNLAYIGILEPAGAEGAKQRRNPGEPSSPDRQPGE
ncbi:MAG: hypoxanthine phosphoribosyltransferase [Chloroflexi bacterium]|nr:hypoxanthine phosphoribosyltransferase [Chloroflexota bacterium]